MLCASDIFVAARRSQMIYLVFVTSVLAVQNGAVLEMTGDAAKIEFGGALTLIHNTAEDQLTCSGKTQASDVLIEGTSTTVADLIGEVAALRKNVVQFQDTVALTQLLALRGPRIDTRAVTGAIYSASGARGAGPAFDGEAVANNQLSYYHSDNQPCDDFNVSIQVKLPSPAIVGVYAITSRYEPPEAHDCCHEWDSPKDWAPQGSNDGTTWTRLHNVTGSSHWGEQETRNFGPIRNPQSFTFYRLSITATNGPTWRWFLRCRLERDHFL